VSGSSATNRCRLESVYIESGLLQLEGYANAYSTQHSALVPLLAGVAARVSGAERHVDDFNHYRWRSACRS